jgi:solute carrier family 25 ornithine transporter 2/15
MSSRPTPTPFVKDTLAGEGSEEMSSQPTPTPFHIKDTLAGAFGSVCLTYAGLPFDVVKLRMQTSGRGGGVVVIGGGGGGSGGPLSVLSSLVRSEGPRVLFRGAAPALSSAFVENSVVFTANGFFTRLLLAGKPEESMTLGEHALVGGLSGVFSATAICPPEVIKCKMQALQATAAAEAKGVSAAQMVVRVWRADGARGFFAGLTPLLLRDVPFNTLFFGSYRAYGRVWAAARERVEAGGGGSASVSGAQAFACGGLAGMTAWTVVFPFDAVKSRMQVGVAPGSGRSGAGVLAALRGVVAEGGGGLHGVRRGLYRGWSAAVLRAFPANAALFWGVETARTVLTSVGID